MSEALWYYDEGGKQAGPITGAAIREAITGGRLTPGTRVWTAGMAGWQPWETVPELAALSAPPALASPPPPPPPAGQSAPPGAEPQGWGAPRPAPASFGAPAARGGLDEVGVGATVALSVVTFGIYGLVKFFQCGAAYARLVPSRPSSFERYFWLYLGLGLGGAVAQFVYHPLGLLLGVASFVTGILLLNEVLAARQALVAAAGARAELTSDATHKVLWIGGSLLAVVFIGLVALVVQAVFFFGDHDKLARALGGRA